MGPIETAKSTSRLPVSGTLVRISDTIKPSHQCGGFLVKADYIANRRPSENAEYYGWVPGAGGDLWWIKHEDGTIGAYEFTEIFDR